MCDIIKSMKSHNGKKKGFMHRDLFIALLIIFLCASSAAVGFWQKLEYRLYDFLVWAKPAVAERDDVVIVSIDNASVAELGAFPWPRDIIADAIIRMRELGAKTVTFDIEYISPSALGVDPVAKQALPEKFTTADENITSVLAEFSDAISSGDLPPEYVPEMTDELINSYIKPEISGLEESITGGLFRNNDEYFAKALHYFGNSWVTINAVDMDIDISSELKELAVEKLLIDNVQDEGNYIPKETKSYMQRNDYIKGFTPALYELVDGAEGAGFTNIVLDEDGTRRRIKLLFDIEDKYAAQLVFAPILGLLKPESIERTHNYLTLKNALKPGASEREDIVIPMDSDGNMLINWIKDSFDESFKNVPVLFLNQLDSFEQNMISILKVLKSFRLRGPDGLMLSYWDAANYLLEEYADLEAVKANLFNDLETPFTESQDAFDSYFERRQVFFEDCGQLCDESFEQEILELLPEAAGDMAETYAGFITDKFTKYRDFYRLYNEYFAQYKKIFDGSFCIVGHTATASTDMGNTPFYSGYANVGTHANVYNTIMSGRFLKPLPWYSGLIFASVLLIFITLIVRGKSATTNNILNIFAIIGTILAVFVLMYFFNIYVEMIASVLILILGYISSIILRFITAEKDKSFLRNTLSTYVSSDVVNEIVNDPTKLKLGGDEKILTAMFTDIRSFSTISEKITPTELVSFLNEYLTLLSDIILENGGTIDKYEGDAIIAFIGAPVPYEDHAWRACISAVRMKQAEARFNERLLADGIIPNKICMPICTRIGINTGSMVVGNMGTQNKMNYTMMGNAVNLAARLEGVNKVYHSWILVSESTWQAADSGEHKGILFARRFDRVRVVGINTPVQLYNILGVKAELPEDLIESVKLFHAGLDCYFKKEFSGAKKLFDAATRKYPSDEAASVFSARCVQNMEKGVPEDWDGVINMTSK